MGTIAGSETGYVPCRNEGCARPARSQTRPGLCQACQSSASYHRKHPDASYRERGYHGKWKGKTCGDCGKAPAKARGLCNTCYVKNFPPRSRTSEENRNARLKSRYGITAEQYQRMVEDRDNRCDICGEPPSASSTRAHWRGKLCVDHNHATGKLRGLLCNNCNLTVGYGKQPAVLERAAEYLRLHNG